MTKNSEVPIRAKTPRICTIDIETSPGIAQVWGLFKQTVSLSQLQEATRVISFAAKWRGKDKVHFFSEFHHGSKKMLQAAHEILSEADVVIHYNGTSFDIPHLKREFWLSNMPPPEPFMEIDLMRVIKRNFRFMSNKLQHVSEQIGIGSKIAHEGHKLWTMCLLNDRSAWGRMREYNKQDVALTERLYESLIPWIDNHPHMGLVSREGGESCNKCGSRNIQYRGFAQTRSTLYRKFQCNKCRGWGRVASKSMSIKTMGIK